MGCVECLAPVVSGRWGSAGRCCARRERWGRLGFRAGARRESGCRRSYARSAPTRCRWAIGSLSPAEGFRGIDLEPVPTRGWSKGGRMGSFSEYSHAIFF